MKRVVVYESGTGFTERSANWIGEDLGCEVKERMQVNAQSLAEYDQVIYGGWIMAGMISGYNKVKAMNPKNLVVFGVGMTIPGDDVVAKLAEQNQIPVESLFYFEGGFNPEKLGFFKKKIIDMIKKSIEKKEEKTEEDIYMLETCAGADRTNRAAIADLITYCEA